MRRAVLAFLLLLPAFAAAAFLGSNPQRKVTSTAASASDTLKGAGTQVLITVTGASATTGAFVTMSATFPCKAQRDTAAAANASFFVPKGVPVIRARPVASNGVTGVPCFAATTADSGNSAVVRFETGSGAP